MIACTASGVAAVGRKIFPTSADTRRGRRCFVTADADYTGRARFLRLPNGDTALLCACYDAFGLGERPNEITVRSRAVRQMFWRGELVDRGDAEFDRVRRSCLAVWQRRLAREQPSVVLTAIHGFDRPGRDGYWQRHGLAVASAALEGALSVGAAHYHTALPLEPDRSPLAATDVPQDHLLEGYVRRMWRHYPVDLCPVYHSNDVRPDAVLRLYMPPHSR